MLLIAVLPSTACAHAETTSSRTYTGAAAARWMSAHLAERRVTLVVTNGGDSSAAIFLLRVGIGALRVGAVAPGETTAFDISAVAAPGMLVRFGVVPIGALSRFISEEVQLLRAGTVQIEIGREAGVRPVRLRRVALAT